MKRDDGYMGVDHDPYSNDLLTSRPQDTGTDPIREAIGLYRKYHRNGWKTEPAISEVVEWLLWLTKSEHGGCLSERMGWIRAMLMDLGEVAAEDVVEVSGATILLLRIYCDTT